jgi:hypothetical protein
MVGGPDLWFASVISRLIYGGLRLVANRGMATSLAQILLVACVQLTRDPRPRIAGLLCFGKWSPLLISSAHEFEGEGRVSRAYDTLPVEKKVSVLWAKKPTKAGFIQIQAQRC